MLPIPPTSTLFPYTTLFRSILHIGVSREGFVDVLALAQLRQRGLLVGAVNVLYGVVQLIGQLQPDRKSTRLNSSHVSISYAVFCLKKQTTTEPTSQSTGVLL